MRRPFAVAMLVLLAACSPGAEEDFTPADRITLSDGSAAVARGEVRAEGGAVTIEMGEFFFEPTVVVAPANEELEITLVNAGDNVHNFEVPERGIDLTFAEGDTETVTLRMPDAAQAMTFQCKFHLPRAMRGELRTG